MFNKKTLALIFLGSILIAIPLALFIFTTTPKEKISLKDFKFIDINNNLRSLDEFRGKIIIVEFMATWCPSCAQQTDNIKKVISTYSPDKIIVIQLSVDPTDTTRKLISYLTSHEINYKNWIIGRDGFDMAMKYGFKNIPSLLIVTPDGEISYMGEGILGAEQLKNQIEEIMR